MARRASLGVCWPNAEQELLLRAALGSGAGAVAAWRAWRRAVDIAEIDAGSFRLLPLLYRNLTALGVETRELGKLKGVYRQSWYRNRVGLRTLAEVLHALREAGVDAIVLKGAALTLACYRDPGVRPMKDLDVLVAPERDAEAAAAVGRLGWAPSPMDYRAAAAESHFRAEGGRELDVHRYLLHHDRYSGADDALRAAAVPLDVEGEPARALAPAHQLFHVLVHGIAWNPVPQIRWVADAITVIRSAGASLRWDTVVAETTRRGFVPPVRAGLGYLRATFDAEVPSDVLRALEDAPVSRLHRLEHWAEQRGPYTPLGWAPLFFCWYVRTLQGTGVRPGVAGYLRFLRSHLGVRTLPAFVLLLLWKLAVTAGRIVGHAAATATATLRRAARRPAPRLAEPQAGTLPPLRDTVRSQRTDGAEPQRRD